MLKWWVIDLETRYLDFRSGFQISSFRLDIMTGCTGRSLICVSLLVHVDANGVLIILYIIIESNSLPFSFVLLLWSFPIWSNLFFTNCPPCFNLIVFAIWYNSSFQTFFMSFEAFHLLTVVFYIITGNCLDKQGGLY